MTVAVFSNLTLQTQMHQSLKQEESVNSDQYNQSFPDKAIIFFMTFMAGTFFFMCMETECLHNEKKGYCGKVSYVFFGR